MQFLKSHLGFASPEVRESPANGCGKAALKVMAGLVCCTFVDGVGVGGERSEALFTKNTHIITCTFSVNNLKVREQAIQTHRVGAEGTLAFGSAEGLPLGCGKTLESE